MKVLAIIAVRNEADVIGAAIGHLVAQGVDVFLIDDGSTDDTLEIARRFLNRGVIGIERFSPANTTDSTRGFAWRALLERKVEVSAERPADWYMHQDADEFRESPWKGVSLRDAIEEVDALGFNAIDFEVFEFRLTNDALLPGADPRRSLQHFAPGNPWDKLQVKCWKRQPTSVDLASSAGHNVSFPNRRVFPVRFILRHYPLRSEVQAARKVFQDRRPRLRDDEKANGWHIHYARFVEGQSFTESPVGLSTYDEAAARFAVGWRHRGVEDLEQRVSDLSARLSEGEAELETTRQAVRSVSAELSNLRRQAASMEGEVEVMRQRVASRDAALLELRRQNERDVSQVKQWLDERTSELERARTQLEQAVGQARRLDDELRQLYGSRSWRWSSPFRAILNWLSGGRRPPLRRD